jgi:hypothetical protein
MRIAWFRPEIGSNSGDDLSPVIDGLRATHEILVIGAPAAHDFVWQASQGAFDLCVYEIDDTPGYQYVWPYLLHYPGVAVLRTSSLHSGRALSLVHQHRDADRDAEIAFADGAGRTDAPWPLLRGSWSTWRVLVLASRLTVVGDDALGVAVRESCPGARVAVTPVGVPDPQAGPVPSQGSAVRVHAVGRLSAKTLDAALLRARQAGAASIAMTSDLQTADVVIATEWPTFGRPLRGALSGLAAGRAVIVADTASTAQWPTVDPQTWQPRAISLLPGDTQPPMAVSIDPRDEEHSLMLALVRLANDAALRRSLGRAARTWWEEHATVSHAIDAWTAVLDEARALAAPPRPAGWPAHLDADGSALMASTLEQFGCGGRL